MLIIGFGVTEVLLSTLVFTCETCGNHAAHQLTKQTRKFSLFFIPLLPDEQYGVPRGCRCHAAVGRSG
jgi:hypothetical protein